MFDLASDLPFITAPQTLSPGPTRHALQQSDLWLDAVRLLGTDVSLADLRARRVLVLKKHLPLVGTLALISRADLGLMTNDAASLRDRVGAKHLVINAESVADASAMRHAGFRRIGAARTIADLTLHPTTDAMAKGLHAKWRNRLRKGQSENLVLRRRPMPPDRHHWLLKAEIQQARRLWYRPLPADLIAALVACRPGAGQVFTAYHAGRRIAAMLFIRHGHSATYQIGWSTDEGRRMNAGPVLMWKAMVDLQSMGIDHIDLGAADPAAPPGLARFKLGTGARLRALGGTWIDSAWVSRKVRKSQARRALPT